MAINPMQRRSRNSMIIGVILGLVIGALVAALLLFQINKLQNDLKKEKAKMSMVPVAAKDIAANSEITAADLELKEVITPVATSEIVGTDHLAETEPKKLTEPTGTVTKVKVSELLNKVYKADNIKAATAPLVNTVTTDTNNSNNSNNNNSNNTNNNNNNSSNNNNNNNGQNATNNSNNAKQTQNSGNNANANQASSPKGKYIAAVKIPKGSIITKDMILPKEDSLTKEENKTQREVEYNMVTLPSELADEDTIDVRVSFPNGQDFVVLSKKTVKKADASTIWLKVNEDEILKMNSAIVESYLIEGAKLYAVNYSKPGLQPQINTTYPVNAEVARLLGNDPNIPQKIKSELNSAANAAIMGERNGINQVIANQEGDSNKVGTAVKNEIKERQNKRKKYIEKLTGESENN